MILNQEKLLDEYKHGDYTARENKIFHRLAYEFAEVSSCLGHKIDLMVPEIDRHGYDCFFFDPEDNVSKYIQLKARYGNTSSWDIHRRFFLPNVYDAMKIAWDNIFTGIGGGIILCDIEVINNSVNITYKYTDLFVLLALANGVFGSDDIQKKAKSALVDLHKDGIDDEGNPIKRISIKEWMFLTPKKEKQIEFLLFMMGFQSNWQKHVRAIHTNNSSDLGGAPIDRGREELKKEAKEYILTQSNFNKES